MVVERDAQDLETWKVQMRAKEEKSKNVPNANKQTDLGDISEDNPVDQSCLVPVPRI
jgi:hypothetical protein